MKILLAILLLSPLASFGQLAPVIPLAPVSAVQMDVRDGASQITPEWAQWWNAHHTELYKKTKALTCHIVSHSQTPVEAKLVYIFMEKDNKSGVHNSGIVPVTIPPRFGIDVPVFAIGRATPAGFSSLGKSTTSESTQPKSWIIQLYVDGKLVAAKSSDSSAEFQKLAQTDAGL